MYAIENLDENAASKWLQMAVDKGHPFAIVRKGIGSGFEYIEPEEKPKKWIEVEMILAKAVENEKWWRRDARLFNLRDLEDSIALAKRRVTMLRDARADARYFNEISANLGAARTFCLERGGTFGNESRESNALLEKCFAIFRLDRTDGDNLPSRRSKALQLSVEAAIMGDGWAAFTVGEILEKAPFPYAHNKEESRRWLGAGRILLERMTKSPDTSRALDAALFLGNQLVRGELLPRDTKAGLRLLEFAAVGGHYRAAADLNDYYEGNEFIKGDQYGIKANAALAAKWDKIAFAIVEGKYQLPKRVSSAKTTAKQAPLKLAPVKANSKPKITKSQKKSCPG
jgi:TPR repeat protein